MGRSAIEEAEIDNLLTDVFRMTGVRIDRNDPLIAVALLQNRFYRKQKIEIDNAISAFQSENKNNHDKLDLILGRISKLPRIFRTDLQKNYLNYFRTADNPSDDTDIIVTKTQDEVENDNTNKHKKQLIFALIIGLAVGFAVGRFLIKYL